MVNKTILPNEEIKINKGAFKGVYGLLECIDLNCCGDEPTVRIKVDHMNTIIVNYSDVEVLYDDYLVYKANINTRNPIKIIGKYRLKMDKVGEIIEDIAREEFKVGSSDFCITATPANEVSFNFNGLSLSVEEIKKIVN